VAAHGWNIDYLIAAQVASLVRRSLLGVGWNGVWVGGGLGTLLGPEGVGTLGTMSFWWVLLPGHLLHGSGAFGCWVGVVGVGFGPATNWLGFLWGVWVGVVCGSFLPVA
jgi:hypothetical protein